MSSAQRVALFDFDGTIADSVGETLAAYNAVALAVGAPRITQEEFAFLRRLDPREVLRELRVPLWKVPRIMAAVRAEMRAHVHTLQPFRGMHELARALAEANVRTGIVSSNSQENVRAFLARHAFSGFEILSCGASLFGKATRIRDVLARLAAPEAQAFYVGDEARDVMAGRKAGVRTVAVSWGFGARDALAAKSPDALVDTPEQLLESLLAR